LLILVIALGCEGILKFITQKSRRSEAVKEKDDVGDHTHLEENASPKSTYQYPNVKWSFLILFLVLFGPLMHSMRGLASPDYFGYHKHWHQKEILSYLDKNFRAGDAVYIYWNATIGYEYYSLKNDYKFSPLPVQDHRYVSKSFDDYLNQIKADMQGLQKYKRVWLIYGKHHFVEIGGFDNNPFWYYNTQNHVHRKHAAFGTVGKLVEHYKTKEKLDLYLYEVGKK
jgi:hypothetical protein